MTQGFVRPSAASGYSGLSGYSGYSGVGTSGFSGFTGVSGYSGYSGASGYSGFSGPSGYSGFSGASGYSGFSGSNPGTSGYSGFSGISGYSGFSGRSGFSGFSGKSASDIRLKRDIRPYGNSFDVLSHINPVVFKWNGLYGYSPDGADVVGVIGQELEAVLPEAIRKRRDRLFPEGEETEIVEIDLNPIVFLLVNAVKQLKREIDELEHGL